VIEPSEPGLGFGSSANRKRYSRDAGPSGITTENLVYDYDCYLLKAGVYDELTIVGESTVVGTNKRSAFRCCWLFYRVRVAFLYMD